MTMLTIENIPHVTELMADAFAKHVIQVDGCIKLFINNQADLQLSGLDYKIQQIFVK